MDAHLTSLFIGRFQPFHLGHLDAIRQIFAEGKTKLLIIGVGSAEENYTPENPFTAGERFEMIYDSLLEADIPPASFNICPIRNIHHYGLWPHHNKLLLPPFTRVYSGSPLVKMLFGDNTNLEVCTLQDNTDITATQVRQQIKSDAVMTDVLPAAVIRLLHKFNATERIGNIDHTQIGS